MYNSLATKDAKSYLEAGLLKSAYEGCSYYKFSRQNIQVEKQKALPLVYEKIKLDAGYEINLLIADKLIAEIKSIKALNDLCMVEI
ncbi:MAG: GxxExxY protein [Dysgonomonas sp.]|nr:GxxExxY protein [Dysgonomonas sp.]